MQCSGVDYIAKDLTGRKEKTNRRASPQVFGLRTAVFVASVKVRTTPRLMKLPVEIRAVCAVRRTNGYSNNRFENTDLSLTEAERIGHHEWIHAIDDPSREQNYDSRKFKKLGGWLT